MIVETNKLMRLSTYAKKIDRCKEMIRIMIKRGELNTVIIDNTIFVVVEG